MGAIQTIFIHWLDALIESKAPQEPELQETLYAASGISIVAYDISSYL